MIPVFFFPPEITGLSLICGKLDSAVYLICGILISLACTEVNMCLTLSRTEEEPEPLLVLLTKQMA